ncbi:MAG: hypothetical protein KBC36_09055 [Spirochaetia bacterium]|nr:hypothetical protein [Spirochaetia bacterium]
MGRGELEERIRGLEAELRAVEGTRTEVYARIVGYYRSVRNWNAGKREEFSRRRPWSVGKEAPGVRRVDAGEFEAAAAAAAEPGATYAAAGPACSAPSARPRGAGGKPLRAAPALKDLVGPSSRREAPVPRGEGEVAEYTVYVRASCPGCPPVKAFLAASGLPGRMVDVDADEGLREALAAGVMSTPTAILADGEGRELARARSVQELRSTLMPVLA